MQQHGEKKKELEYRIHCTHSEIELFFLSNQLKSYCIYHFPIDSEPNGIYFVSKSFCASEKNIAAKNMLNKKTLIRICRIDLEPN